MRASIIYSAFFSGLLFIAACSKEPEAVSYPEATLDYVYAGAMIADIMNFSESAIRQLEDTLSLSKKKGDASCKSNGISISMIPFDSLSWPKIFIIDFGDSGVVCTDNRTRKGTIKIQTDRFYDTPGCITLVSTPGYQVDGHGIQTGIRQTFTGNSNSGSFIYSFVVDEFIYSNPSRNIRLYMDLSREWAYGYSTAFPLLFDDYFLVSGSGKGYSSDGKPFEINILDAEVFSRSCFYAVNGKTEIAASVTPPFILDFGSGECDAAGILTGGNSSTGISFE